MNDLIGRLRDAIDEDERIAQAALNNPCHYDRELRDYVDDGVDDGQWEANGFQVNTANPPPSDHFRGGIAIDDEGGHTEGQATHIARHDPARVLRMAAAHRQILDLHAPCKSANGPDITVCAACGPHGDDPTAWMFTGEVEHYPCDTVLALADPYRVNVEPA